MKLSAAFSFPSTLNSLPRFLLNSYFQNSNVNPSIRKHLEEKKLTYPQLQLMFGERANEFLKTVELDEAIQEAGKLTESQGLVIFQLPAPLAQYWWKSDARVSAPRIPREKTETDLEWAQQMREWDEAVRKWEELQDKIKATGASTLGAESGIKGMAIEWGDIYDGVMGAFHKARDGFLQISDLCMARVNQIAQHDPNHYYYVWVARQKEEQPLEDPYDEEGNLRYLSYEALERLKRGQLDI